MIVVLSACSFFLKLPGFINRVEHNKEYQRTWINKSCLIIYSHLRNCLSSNLRKGLDSLKSTRQVIAASMLSTGNNCSATEDLIWNVQIIDKIMRITLWAL